MMHDCVFLSMFGLKVKKTSIFVWEWQVYLLNHWFNFDKFTSDNTFTFTFPLPIAKSTTKTNYRILFCKYASFSSIEIIFIAYHVLLWAQFSFFFANSAAKYDLIRSVSNNAEKEEEKAHKTV